MRLPPAACTVKSGFRFYSESYLYTRASFQRSRVSHDLRLIAHTPGVIREAGRLHNLDSIIVIG